MIPRTPAATMGEVAWSRRRFLAGSAGAVVAGSVLSGGLLSACGLQDASSNDRDTGKASAGWGGQLLDPPLAKPDVTFTTTADGKAFPFRQATKGKLTLLFFGYTNCPNECPVYLNTLARAREAIGSGPGSAPQVLFVGVDTKRDTPAAMQTYLENIDPAFIGLTATPEVIDEAQRQLMFPPVLLGEPDADGSYAVGHAARAVAFTADNVAHRLYGYDVRQQELVHDLPRLAEGTYT